MPGDLEIHVAHNAAQLVALEDDWLSLQRQGRLPSPFQEWSWVMGWVRHFVSPDRPPLVLLARDAQGPLALLPLQRSPLMGRCSITWLGAPALQYGGMLMRPMNEERRTEVFSAMWRALATAGGDVLNLPLLPAEAPLAAFLQRRCRTGPENFSFRIDLSRYDSWRSYELSLRPTARRARRKRVNKLKRMGALSFRVRPAGPDNMKAIRLALDWKREWLRQRGLNNALPLFLEYDAFLRELFGKQQCSAAGERVVAELTLDGVPIAMELGMILDGVVYSWSAAYDLRFAHLSPGKAALWMMLQWCMAHGIRAYDMLANAAPYKEQWANERLPLLHFVAPLSGIGQALSLWLTHGEHNARRLHDALPPALRTGVRERLGRLLGK